MGEIIKLLRQQIDLCQRLLLAVERQRQALCDGSGDSMSKETKAIEVLLIELRRIEKRQELLLKGTATHDLAELLSRTAPSEERAVARRLLEETNGIMREMQEAVAMNGALLERHMQFILFNINVMAGTPAEATYTVKDVRKGKKQTSAETKVFDANV
ncbi:flagellar protein FlgN [Selenomonas sp. CM52]|uniref:flagellar protein FlgN n=1 Tax=Selenomonas sp. CM52 TaxID=936381 RepID=UPI00027C4004|nr:flagellar protein FlgN [Selenomonas sp. CM52]EJU27588.1 FlgN protein [Selenomonas sp. CM52]